jgi:hypothetical protein
MRAGRDRMGRPVEASGDRYRGDVQEVAGGAGEAAVGGERDHGGGEVGDGLDGEADRQRGRDAATVVDGGEASGCEEPGEPEHGFGAGAGEHAKATPPGAELVGALPSGGAADERPQRGHGDHVGQRGES